MKKIYIMHQYLDKDHFKALYECAKENGYVVEDYFVLDKFFIIKNILKKVVFQKTLGLDLKSGFDYCKKLKRLKAMHNELIIVGLAPYDRLLNKYEKVIKHNRCIYFSSWQTWDGSSFPRGSLDNRSYWEMMLKKYFIGAACVSKKTKDNLEKFVGNAIVVNHAINVDEYVKRDFSTNNYRFLYFGRLEDNKNIRWMIDWINENKNLEFEFDFAGFGTYQVEIECLAKQDKRVTYLGLLTKEQIKTTLCSYDFVVMPSKFEPFGIALLEALAAGVPCITSNASGPAEIIRDGHNGLVCNKESYFDFCRVMNSVFSLSNDEYLLLCRNALVSGMDYSVKSIARKWCTFFDSLS